MIKFGLKLGMLGIMGAALMGCSDSGAQQSDGRNLVAQSSGINPSDVSTKPTDLFFLECLQVNPPKQISIKFDDGPAFSLPEEMLSFVGETERPFSKSAFENVKKFGIEFSNDVCGKTLNMEVRNEYVEPSFAFTPQFSLSYAFAIVEEGDMSSYFKDSKKIAGKNSVYKISIADADAQPPAGIRSRFTELQRKRQQTLKINPSLGPQLLHEGQICRQSDKACGYFQLFKPGPIDPKPIKNFEFNLSLNSDFVTISRIPFEVDVDGGLDSLKLNPQELETAFEMRDYFRASLETD